MNKFRLNQIVKILLFPFIDSELGKQDYLLSCYVSYDSFQKLVKDNYNSVIERQKKNNDYIQSKKRLYKYLLERNHWRVKNEDDVEQICNIYYSMEELNEYVNYIQKFTGDRVDEEYCINCYYLLKVLSSISCSLITYRDGIAAIRPWIEIDKGNKKVEMFNYGSIFNKIEIWSLLGRILSPDILIAIAAVENGLGIEALYEQDFNILLADKLLVKSLQNGLAENHIHFNVGIDYQMIWLGYMNISFVEKLSVLEFKKYKHEQKEKICKRIQMALFRYFAADFLEKKGDDFSVYLNKEVSPCVRKIMFYLYKGECNEELEQEVIWDIERLSRRLDDNNTFYGEDYLYDKVYAKYVELKTSSEFILLYKAYGYVKGHKGDKVFVRSFLQYLRLKNEFYHNYHEEYFLQGLTYFQKQYNQARETVRESIEKEKLLIGILRSQAKIKYLKKLEIRVSPEVSYDEQDYFDYQVCRKDILSQLYKQILKILEAYRRFLLESTLGVKTTNELLVKMKNKKITEQEKMGVYEKIKVSDKRLPNIGIIFHFLKRSNLENMTSYYCWRKSISFREKQNAYGMQRRYFIQNIAIALEEIRQKIPKIDEYIVGLDSASNENMEEPWMYASAYKIVRSHEVTKPVVMFKEGECNRIQNIGLTYHVGEDFRHILSGFRHVDEVLTEFGYKPGDRLGHALVLGIDIKEWIRNNEIIAIPVMEYMEDLLWVWGINLYSGIELGISLEILEDKILTLARELYKDYKTITVRMLYYAYKKKFECNHKEIAEKYIEKNDKNNFCRWNENCYKEWDEEKLLLTYYCPVFQKKYNKTILVSVDLEQALMYQKIQDYLVKKTAEKGIYIETNPTSNETIGDFSEMMKHPIFYLNPAGREFMHRAMVTVNSDDPLVFGTNVENEMAYIYYAAEAQGISKEEIIWWIEKIRIHGMNASFVQQEKDNMQILNELDIMIAAIEKIQYNL